MTSPPIAPPSAFPLDAADLCVKCGLCLPHCPTYGETRHEADSPRGRIALMQGLASGAIADSSALHRHLDGCLACRACERVCPAKVPYGQLIDAGRALLALHQPSRTRATRMLDRLLSSDIALRALAALLWLYRATGLQRLVRASRLLGRGRLARLESLIPARRRPAAARSAPAPAAAGETISLFSGCVGRLLDDDALRATQVLFERFGCRVSRPAGQTCCGAIAEHGGLPAAAAAHADRNLRAFAAATTVVHVASGCGATLIDYPRLASDPQRGATFAGRVEEACSALLRRWPRQLALRPLPARVAVHLPCTHRNVLGHGGDVTALLRKIPGIDLVELDVAQRCCGAAGTHFITQPEMADRLLAPKLRNAEQLRVDYIVSTNIGCSLHLAGGLQRHGRRAPEVLHPAVLLARQLAG
ncbi:(Fe-S)-binding protein [Fontimonas sp. SYSU GA230001]|uniref:(Fe-S)-binding protein n=1 Tax=Fontimonas sp. SYSU GA230001 TaxID=3142450 RepID=UPI0032B56C32